MNSASVLSAAFFAFILILGAVDGAGLKACPASSPDLSLCVRYALQELVPSLASGIPSIGSDSTDPLQNLPPIKYRSQWRVAPLSIQLDNIVITGLASALINDVQVDLSSNTIRIQSSVPGELVASGVHSTEGEIMGISLRGSGPARISLVGAGLDLTLRGHPQQGPDGRTYLQFDAAKVALTTGVPSAQIEGFFPSFPPLASAASSFANSISGAVISEMQPTLEKWLEDVALQRARAVFSTVSLDELFPGQTPGFAAFYRTFPGYYY